MYFDTAHKLIKSIILIIFWAVQTPPHTLICIRQQKVVTIKWKNKRKKKKPVKANNQMNK